MRWCCAVFKSKINSLMLKRMKNFLAHPGPTKHRKAKSLNVLMCSILLLLSSHPPAATFATCTPHTHSRLQRPSPATCLSYIKGIRLHLVLWRLVEETIADLGRSPAAEGLGITEWEGDIIDNVGHVPDKQDFWSPLWGSGVLGNGSGGGGGSTTKHCLSSLSSKWPVAGVGWAVFLDLSPEGSPVFWDGALGLELRVGGMMSGREMQWAVVWKGKITSCTLLLIFTKVKLTLSLEPQYQLEGVN